MTKNIRIIVKTLEQGGTEQHLIYILPKLFERGWNIRVIVLNDKAALAHLLFKKGIFVSLGEELKFVPFLKHFISIFVNIVRLLKDYKKYPSDITHFFLPESYLIGMLAAFIARDKSLKIMSRRSLNCYQKRRPFWGWIEKKFLHSRSSLILGNSKAVLKQLHDEEKVPLKKLHLIYNGINTKLFKHNSQYRKEERESLNIKGDEIVFIVIANIIYYKGHKDLIDALSIIKNKFNNWKLLCVGEDYGILEDLKNYSLKKNISEQIFWLSKRSDLNKLLSASDIGVLSSHEEGFSNAILEYMAAAIPVVATNVGGNAEAVKHNVTGYIAPPHSPEKLAKYLLRLAKDPGKRHFMGSAATTRVEKYFNIDQCIDNYHVVYQKLCKR
ncbi:MAG: glycosyltransferase [Alphaproteobacteria bacterium]